MQASNSRGQHDLPSSEVGDSQGKKKCYDHPIIIQLCWNVIIKALWGAESSKNKACEGEQPSLSVPPGYFTYLQSKQLSTPTTPLAPYCGNG